MTPRRRVEVLAAALDNPRAVATLDDRLRPLLEVAGTLRTAEAARTPAQFRASLRDQLMSESLEEHRPAISINPRQATGPSATFSTRLSRAVAAAVAAFVVLALFGSATLHAVPGDLLYGVKRQAEALELLTARSQLSRGHALLDRAGRRLDEVGTLARRRQLARVPRTMADMDRATSRGAALLSYVAFETGQITPLADLQAFTVRQQQALAEITTLLGPAERARADQSLRLLDTIRTATSEAIANLSGSPAPPAPSGSSPGTGPPQSGTPSAPAGTDATQTVPAVPALPADRTSPSAPASSGAAPEVADTDGATSPTSAAATDPPAGPQPVPTTSPVVPPVVNPPGGIVPPLPQPQPPPPLPPAPTVPPPGVPLPVVTTPPLEASLPSVSVTVTVPTPGLP